MSSITTTELSLLRLLQLVSPALPVGAYAFSQGLETAIHWHWIRKAEDVQEWLTQQLRLSLASLDLPVLLRLHRALLQGDAQGVGEWNNFLLASRETSELRLSDTATGEALTRLLPTLQVPLLPLPGAASFVTRFAEAAVHWQIDEDASLLGLAWSWLELQVAAATKLVPLGQTQAQQVLSALQREIPGALCSAHTLPDDALGAALPGLAIASMQHETQYTRLFRS